jgi:hypothetical protein
MQHTNEPCLEQNDKTNGNIEFLQPYPIVPADARLYNGTRLTSLDSVSQ